MQNPSVKKKRIKIDSSFLKIGQAAQALGVSIDTLRRWEKAGKISTVRTPGGTRLYHISALKEINPAAEPYPIETYQTDSLSTEELLKRAGDETLDVRNWKLDQTSNIQPQYPVSNLQHPTSKLISKFLIGSAFVSTITLLLSSWITASYLTQPKSAQQFFKNNIASGLLSPFHTLAQEMVAIIDPRKAKELGFIPPEYPPPIPYTLNLKPSSNVLAVTASSQFLEVNADTQINGALFVRDSVNGLSLEATPSANSFVLGSGDTTLTVTNDALLDQDVSTAASPTFNTLNLSATKDQLVFQSGGPTGTLTWTPTAARVITLPDATGTVLLDSATQTITNKTINASNNTITNIPNSALANNKVTVTAGTNLTGGGDITLGSSATISLKDSISLSGTLTAGGVVKLADGTAAAPGLTFTNDTDTGLYRIGANSIGLITGGSATSGITIDASGNVGIGTISPSYTLDVTGRVNGSTALCIGGDCKTAWSGSAGNTASNGLTLSGVDLQLGGSLTRATGIDIASQNFGFLGGNVGIGTTSAGGSLVVASGNVGIGFTSPDRTTQIASDINITPSLASLLGANGTQFAITGSTAANLQKKLTFGLDTSDNYGVIQVGNTSGTAYGLVLNPAGGNVGIGTTNLNARIAGTSAPILRVVKSDGVGGGTIEVQNTTSGGGDSTVDFIDENGNVRGNIAYYARRSASDPARFVINQGWLAEITPLNTILNENGGNVGIGTTGPLSLLSVAGNAHIGNLYQSISAPTNGLFVDGNVGIGATTSSNKLDVWGNTRIAGTLTVDSTITPSGQVLAIDGSKTAPSYSFASSGNGDNGMYLPSANALSFATAGNDVLTLTAGGNVGIGTTAPNTALEILSTSTPQFRITHTATGYSTITVTSTGGVTFDAVGSSAGFTFSDAVTISANNAALSLTGTTPSITAGGSVLGLFAGGNVGIGTTGNLYGGLTVRGAGTGTGITLQTYGSNLTQGLSVLDNGNVGIGTTNPTFQLQTTGSVGIGGSLTVSSGLSLPNSSIQNANLVNSAITVSATAGTGISVSGSPVSLGGTLTVSGIDASTTVKGVASFNSTNFSVSSGAVNTIQDIATSSSPSFVGLSLSSGNLGIGTSATGAKLQVNGGGIFWPSTTSLTGPTNGLAVFGNVGIGTTTANSLLSVAGGAHIGALYQSIAAPTNGLFVDGNVGIGATSTAYNLDVWGTSRITSALTVGGNVGIGASASVASYLSVGSLYSAGAVCLGSDCRTSWPATVTGESTTASNGLTLSTYDVRLGGILTQATGIDISGQNFGFLGNIGIGTSSNGGARLSVMGGNVGIGTTTANSNLSVSGNAHIGSLYQGISAPANGMFVDGNVGIGATSTAYNLDVWGTGRFSSGLTVGGNVGIGQSLTVTSGTVLSGGLLVNGGSVVLPAGSIGNSELENSSITVSATAGTGISVSGSPVSLGGTLTVAGIDASTSVKGVASFNSTNFSVSSGAVNTIQDIATSATPTFVGLNTTSGNVGIGTSATGSRLSVNGNGVIGWGTASLTGPTNGLAVFGNVGIGTTSPGYKLDVVGQINGSTGLCIAGDCKTSWTGVGGYTASNGLTLSSQDFQLGGSLTRATGIDIASQNFGFLGNIGIGTSNNTGARLSVLGGNVGIGTTTANSLLSVAGGAHIGALYQSIVAPTNGLFVDGNVGIGATTSSNKLDVWGNARVAGTGTFDSTITALNGLIGYSGVTAPTNGLAVSGNVGIGTTSPLAKLHNTGGTLFGTLSVSNLASGGNIGTAATTVDIYTSFNLSQTTASQTITLPDPTNTTAGRIIYLSNTGTTPFTFYGSTVKVGDTTAAMWDGDSWNLAGGGGLNQGTVSNSILRWNSSSSQWVENGNILAASDGTLSLNGNLGVGTTATPDYNLKVLGTGYFSGFVGIGSSLNVSGNVGIGQSLTVTSAGVFSGGLAVNGGSVVLPAGSIGNSELENSSITVSATAGTGISVSGSPVSLGGTLTVAGIDASTSVKGVASFNSTNFSVSSGAVNTIQDIATTSSPTFVGLSLTSGNLGIGTSATGAKLAVNGNGVIGWGTASVAGPNNGLAVSGNVGVGTTSPNNKLQVIGAGVFGGDYGQYSAATNGLLIQGNVGIGATTSSNKLDVWGNSRIAGNLTVDGTLTTGAQTINGNLLPGLDNIYALGSTSLRWSSLHVGPGSVVVHNDATNTNWSKLDFAGSVAQLITDSSTPIQMVSGTTNLGMYINTSGNVGIGTTNPNYKLDVSGTANVSSNTTIGGTLAVTGNTTLTGIVGIGSAPSADRYLNVNGGASAPTSGATQYALVFNGYLSGTTTDYGILAAPAIYNNITAASVYGTAVWEPFKGTGAAITSQTGYQVDDLAGGTNNTLVLIGTRTIPSGNYSLYSSSTKQSYFAGNIGIGTSTPKSNLTVVGNALIGKSFTGISAPASGLFVEGNVGIGASTSSNKLDVWGNGRIAGNLTVDGTLSQNGNISTSGVFLAANGSASAPSYSFTNLTNAGLWTNGNGLLLTTGGSNTSGITVTGAGNVGIGTTSPTFQLQTTGNVGIGGSLTVSSGLSLPNSSITNANLVNSSITVSATAGTGISVSGSPVSLGGTLTVAGIDASTSVKGVASFNSTNFSVSSGAVNTIQDIATTSSPTFVGLSLTSGNLGIGTSATGAKLQVNGGGIFWPSTTSLTGPTNGLAVSGNVGIGTTSPGYKLDVIGQINGSTGLCIAGDCKTAWSGVGGYTASNGLTLSSTDFQLGGQLTRATGIDINSQNFGFLRGNVGIGITNPGSALTVIGNVGIGTSAAGAALQVNGGGLFGWGTASVAAPANGLAINGNVGIGTSSPAANLEIIPSSNSYLRFSSTGDAPSIQMLGNGDGANYAWFELGRKDSNQDRWQMSMAADGSNRLRFIALPTNSENLSLLPGGNVGIGASLPQAKFVVQGNVGIGYTGANQTIPANGLAVFGNVGIGATTANSNLSVSGNAHIGALYQGTAAPTNGLFVDGNVGIGATSTAYNLDVWGTGRFTSALTVGGNVGIGSSLTVTSAGVFSGGLLVNGGSVVLPSGSIGNSELENSSITVSATAGTGISVSGSPVSLGGTLTVAGIDASTSVKGVASFNSTNFSVSSGAVNTIQDIATTSSPTFVGLSLSSGNLGIGTSATGAKLQVNGGGIFWPSTTSLTGPTNGLAVFGNVGIGTTTANSNLSVVGNAHIGGLYQGISAPANGLFVDGNVGIGATTSSNKLDVWGNSRIAGTLTVDSTSSFGGNLTLNSGQFLAPNGTSALPSYSFANSTSTGMYSPSANALSLVTNGAATPAFTITAGGNVGIGTTAPSAILETVLSDGSGRRTDLRLTLTGPFANDSAASIGFSRANSGTTATADAAFISSPWTGSSLAELVFATGGDISNNGTEKVRINSSGNVGIGFTSPDRLIQIASDINLVGSNASLLGAAGTQFAITGSSGTGGTEKKLVLGIDTTDNFGVIQAGAVGTNYALALNPAGGNVGIGTTTANSNLSVAGSAHIGALYQSIVAPANGLFVDGNVGIGATSTAYNLDVWGTGRFTSALTVGGNVGIGSSLTVTSAGVFSGGLAVNGGSVVLPAGSIGNSELENSSITVSATAGTGISVSGSPVSLGGTLTVAGIDASTSVKGVASFNSTNFSVSSGAVNTIQDIATSATPTFVGVSLTSGNLGIGTSATGAKLQVNGGGIFWPSTTSLTGPTNGLAVFGNVGIGTTTANSNLSVAGSAHIGALYQSIVAPANGLFVDGNVGIGATTSSNKLDVWGNVGIGSSLTVGSNLTLSGYNCSGLTNGGTLTTDSSGNVICSTDDGGGGSSALSAITAAAGANSINNGDNAQVWNWQLTTADKAAFTFGENTASTATGKSAILLASTLANSTAMPLYVQNYGNGLSFRVDDVSGDTSPFVIDPSGNVGIGFTSPDRNLQIASDINITATNASLLGANGSQFVISGGSGTGGTEKKLVLGIDTTDNYGVIQAGNTSGTAYNLALNPAGGNVGIGTSSPGAKLEVDQSTGDVALFFSTQAANDNPIRFRTNQGDSSIGLVLDNSNTNKAAGIRMQPTTGSLTFNTGLTSGGGLTTATEKMQLDTNGNLGIGTQTPIAQLDVRDTGTGTTLHTYIGSGAGQFGILDNGNVGIGTSNPSQLFQINTGSSATVITSAGNLGIGTTTANSLLSVAGGAHIGALYQSIAAPANGLFVDGNVGIGATSTAYNLDVWGTGRFTSALTVGGNVGIGQSLTVTSAGVFSGGLAVNGGSVVLPAGSIGNSELENSSITVSATAGTGISVSGSPVSLGGTLTVAGIDASTSVKGVASFNSTNFSVSSGAVNTIQDIATSATPTFVGLNTTSGNLGIGTSATGSRLSVNGNGVIGWGTAAVAGPSNGLAVFGNVGIGATTANSNLSISGNAHIGALYQGTVAPTNGLFVDGNVGIGATTSSNKLDVWGNARIAGTLALDSSLTLASGQFLAPDGTASLPSFSFSGDTDTGLWRLGTNFLALTTNGGGALQSGTTINGLSINANGNVGIGTTNPTAALDVAGATSTISNTTGNLTITPASNLLVSSGNVGIGATTSSNKLDVWGNARIAGTTTIDSTLTALNGLIGYSGVTAPSNGLAVSGNVGIGATIPGTLLQVGRAGATGDLTVYGTATTCTIGNGTGATNCSSDIRLKTDINSLPSSTLDDIMRLNPVTFKWIDQSRPQSNNLGFIAQEVQQVFPEFVRTLPDGYLGLDYAALVVPAIKAIQEQQAEINNLIANQATSSAALSTTLSVSADGTLNVPKLQADKITLSADMDFATAPLNALISTTGGTGITSTTGGGYEVDVLASLNSISTAVLGVQTQESTTSAQLADIESRVESQESRVQSLEEKLASISAQIATSSTQQSASSSASEATASSLTTNYQLPTTNSLDLTPPDILLATQSAQLVNLEVTSDATISGQLTTYDLDIQNSLKSLGTTTLGDTLVAGDFTIDGIMTITANSISTLGDLSDSSDLGILYIQNSPLAEGVDFFNGLVTIDKTGKLVAQEIITPSVVTNKLTISNTPIASSSASLQPSIGSATIPAGQTKVAIATDALTPNSKVFITPKSSTQGQTPYVELTEPGVGFVVSIDNLISRDIDFDWWIVESKN